MIVYRSTRDGAGVDLPRALEAGIAPDGGLYVPASLPHLAVSDFEEAATPAEIARVMLAPFVEGSRLDACLSEICAETFSFPLPLRELATSDGHLSVLELFHGPTAAFKDVGARFLASALVRLRAADESDQRPILILVATSGDTGGAVAAAFHRRQGFEVGVLFPLGRVSSRQQHQLTCWGENVCAFAIRGSFDDCQRLVKQAFADPALNERYRFSSANSINIGRLLPQCAYFAFASMQHWRTTGNTLSFIVPSGNLGNGLACLLARAVGLPIADIVLATNANRTIPDYFASGDYEARASIETLASAMDVGDPSNMERLRALFGDAAELNGLVSAVAVSDESIREQIRKDYRRFGFAWCPHTATAMHVYDNLPPSARAEGDWAVVATAHPAKFESVVEPLVGRRIELPAVLADILDRKASFRELDPVLESLERALARR